MSLDLKLEGSELSGVDYNNTSTNVAFSLVPRINAVADLMLTWLNVLINDDDEVERLCKAMETSQSDELQQEALKTA